MEILHHADNRAFATKPQTGANRVFHAHSPGHFFIHDKTSEIAGKISGKFAPVNKLHVQGIDHIVVGL